MPENRQRGRASEGLAPHVRIQSAHSVMVEPQAGQPVKQLVQRDWGLQLGQVPFSLWQMFLFDPNGVEVELDFAQEETPPSHWKAHAGLGNR